MNGIWNRRLIINPQLIFVLAIALLFGGMGGGDENLTGRLPLPEKTLLSASLTELECRLNLLA